jgi:cytochrome d ubiquinol oxidase subunit I
VFFAFRLMVGIGVAMIALAWFTAWLTRGGAMVPRWLLWTLAGFTFSGWLATLSGWIVTEIGRQPWLVQGVMRTSEAVGEITGAQLGVSLTGYALTYAAMFVAYMVVLTHLAGEGAEAGAAKTLPGASPAGAAAD